MSLAPLCEGVCEDDGGARPCPHFKRVVEAAANGALTCMKALRARGGSWGVSCYMALMGGHLDCLTYAIENGAHWGNRDASAYAIHRGDAACLRYALEHGLRPQGSACLAKMAVRRGELDCFAALHETGWVRNGLAVEAHVNRAIQDVPDFDWGPLLAYLALHAPTPQNARCGACTWARRRVAVVARCLIKRASTLRRGHAAAAPALLVVHVRDDRDDGDKDGGAPQ